VGVAEAGTGAPEGDRSRGVNGYVMNTITPETQRTSHYFWAFMRNYRLDSQLITTQLREGVRNVFAEDEAMLAAQQAAIEKTVPGNHWNEPHDAAVKAITQGLVKLGLLKGKVPAHLCVMGHEGGGKDVAYQQTRCINLAKRGMLALNVEWLGFGHSDRPDVSYTPELLEDQLEHWLERTVRGEGGADVIGLSLGATYAVELARRRPDLIRSIVAIEPFGLGDEPSEIGEIWARLLFSVPGVQRAFYDQVGGTIQYPFSQTRRFEVGVSGTHVSYDIEVIRYIFDCCRQVGQEQGSRPGPPSISYGQGTVALVGDYSIFGLTSPVAGGTRVATSSREATAPSSRVG
jgi:hypothetical protein